MLSTPHSSDDEVIFYCLVHNYNHRARSSILKSTGYQNAFPWEICTMVRSSPNWEPVRLVDDSESDESFRQRQSEAKEEKKANRRLNELNKTVREEIDTRLWATMYLQYLMKRIHTAAPVHIEFTDLPNIKNLSLSDEALAPSPEEHLERPFRDLSLEIQLL
ncbi:unnamed protein product [Clonostachys rosea f. rosea IK726]|uniref:Uncharacterized protein n=1 Tax=Clonostachys rosea f. rosea IK726 TaxID=1349383 RepID=A0ACA9UJ36_BIOOC|nr:unnamed protein product [Clonostachys rosea f. rosea IK726]